MRKIILIISFLCSLLSSVPAASQLNKAYFFYVGRSFLIDDNYEAAIETLNILLKVDADAHEGYFLRGVAKFNLDDLLGAEDDFTTAIIKNPVYTLAYQYRAITRLRLGNYDDALRDFEVAIDLRPDRAGPYYSRGVTYFLSQQFEKAIEDFDRFIRYESRVPDAYLHRGNCYLQLNDTIRAFEEFDRAISTNREIPQGYAQRGRLYIEQEKWNDALADLDMAVKCDSTYVPALFFRAIVHSNANRPMQALSDLDAVIRHDGENASAYFNRALVRTHIGDYNNAIEDFNTVATYTPGNVLVYFNRASVHTYLGNLEAAIDDYTCAIELYPDFARAYLNRAELKYFTADVRGARRDRDIAEMKIAESRSRLADSTLSIYADTSRMFNQMVSFDSRSTAGRIARTSRRDAIVMMPMFRFTLASADTVTVINPRRYFLPELEKFTEEFGNPWLRFTSRDSDYPIDSLIEVDRRLAVVVADSGDEDWKLLFKRGITQSLMRQYTNSVNTYSAAIEKNPNNPFLYINRSATRSEMIDFISSIDDPYERFSVDTDPVNRLKAGSGRTYNYDEAIADLNKAARLFPQCAYIYYNRGNLYAQSGYLPEAYEEYTRAIELNPDFAEAYYNRGLVQIYLEDTRKGCLDVSKAGELGIREAYKVLRIYAPRD